MFYIQAVGQSHALLRGQRFQVVIDGRMVLHHRLTERLDIVAQPLLGSQFAQFHLGHATLGGREDEVVVRRGKLRFRLGA